VARGEFLKDLSEGIFGRLSELSKEQQVRDDQKKQQTLSFLSSLADKVEPESLPLLMQQIGDVAGMKGKLRGFWDAFSGMPNRSVEDQLGTKMRELSDSLIGPDTARLSRESNLQQLLQPYRQQKSRPRSVEALPGPPELQGKMIFRDPRREKLQELEERYSAQAQIAADRQALGSYYQSMRQEDQQKFQKELAEYKSELKAKEDIDARAQILANKLGFVEPNKAIKMQAAQELAREQGWSNDQTRARTSYLQARTDESRAMANSVQKSGGLTPSQQVNVEDRRREAARSLKGAFDKAMARRAEAKKIMNDITAFIESDLAKRGSGVKFDPATGSLITDPKDPDSGIMRYRYQTQLEQYNKAAADLAGAETEAKGQWGNLRTFPYSKYYKPGKEFTDPVSEIDAERTSTGTATPGAKIQIPAREGVTYNKGQWVSYGGRRYVVIEVQSDGTTIAVPWKKGM
jgi:hypothetical protein